MSLHAVDIATRQRPATSGCHREPARIVKYKRACYDDFFDFVLRMDLGGLTQLLNADQSNLNRQQQRDLEQVYQHLKKIAKTQKFKINSPVLNTTALVNEAWLKTRDTQKAFNDRDHFFAYCALAMRHILINQARKNKLVTYVDDDKALNQQPVYQQSDRMLELDRQLQRLRKFSPRLEQIFTYKYFGDMEFAQIATLLDVSERTVFRDWQKARAMLSVAME